MQELNRTAGLADRYAQQEMQSGINETAAYTGAISALGSLAGAGIEANALKGASAGGGDKLLGYKDWTKTRNVLAGEDVTRKSYRAYKKKN